MYSQDGSLRGPQWIIDANNADIRSRENVQRMLHDRGLQRAADYAQQLASSAPRSRPDAYAQRQRVIRDLNAFIAQGFPQGDFKAKKEYIKKAQALADEQERYGIENPAFDTYVQQTIVPQFVQAKDAFRAEMENIPDGSAGNDAFVKEWYKKYKDNEDIFGEDPAFEEIRTAAGEVGNYARGLDESKKEIDKRRKLIPQDESFIKTYSDGISHARNSIERLRSRGVPDGDERILQYENSILEDERRMAPINARLMENKAFLEVAQQARPSPLPNPEPAASASSSSGPFANDAYEDVNPFADAEPEDFDPFAGVEDVQYRQVPAERDTEPESDRNAAAPPAAPGMGSRRPSMDTIFSEGAEGVDDEEPGPPVPAARRAAAPRPLAETAPRRGLINALPRDSIRSNATMFSRAPAAQNTEENNNQSSSGVMPQNRNGISVFPLLINNNQPGSRAPWEPEHSPIRNQRHINYDRIIPQFNEENEEGEEEQGGYSGFAYGGPVGHNYDRGINKMNPALAFAAMEQRRQAPQNPAMGYSSAPLPQQQAPIQQQMPPQMSDEQESSSLKRGASAAYEAARNSLRMNKEDRSRSLGSAISALGAGLAKPGYGSGGNGTLAAIAQSLPGATDAYNASEDAIRAQKLQEFELQRMERDYFAKQQKDQEDRKLEREKLSELARYHNILGANHKKETQKEMEYNRAQKRKEELQEQYPGAVPYEAMSGWERTAAVKKHREMEKNIPQYSEMIRDLEKLEQINTAYPGLASPKVRMLYKEGPGFAAQSARALIPNEEKEAFELSNKIINNLLGNKVKNLGGGRINVFIEKTLGKSLPGVYHTPETVKYLVENGLKDAREAYETAKLAPKMISGQFDLPYGVEIPEKEEKAPPAPPAAGGMQAAPQLSPEQQEELRQIRAEREALKRGG